MIHDAVSGEARHRGMWQAAHAFAQNAACRMSGREKPACTPTTLYSHHLEEIS